MGVGVGDDKELGGGGWTKFERGEVGKIGRGLHKLGKLAPLCQLWKETQLCKETFPSPIIKPTPPFSHSWPPPISSKDFPSPFRGLEEGGSDYVNIKQLLRK